MSAPINPNLVTLLRLPLAPLTVAAMLFIPGWKGMAVALTLSLLLEATDALDGWLARRFDAVTDFGKLFDPFSDAFSRFTLFLGLWAVGVADLWMILILFYRDSSISFFRSIAATRGTVMPARNTGKIKALVQAAGCNAILLLLLLSDLGSLPEWLAWAPEESRLSSPTWWIMVVVTGVTAISFFDYLAGSMPILRASWQGKPPSEGQDA